MIVNDLFWQFISRFFGYSTMSSSATNNSFICYFLSFYYMYYIIILYVLFSYLIALVGIFRIMLNIRNDNRYDNTYFVIFLVWERKAFNILGLMFAVGILWPISPFLPLLQIYPLSSPLWFLPWQRDLYALHRLDPFAEFSLALVNNRQWQKTVMQRIIFF